MTSEILCMYHCILLYTITNCHQLRFVDISEINEYQLINGKFMTSALRYTLIQGWWITQIYSVLGIPGVACSEGDLTRLQQPFHHLSAPAQQKGRPRKQVVIDPSSALLNGLVGRSLRRWLKPRLHTTLGWMKVNWYSKKKKKLMRCICVSLLFSVSFSVGWMEFWGYRLKWGSKIDLG